MPQKGLRSPAGRENLVDIFHRAFAELATLPRSYAGERHIVKIAAQSESRGLDQYEERSGAGPTIEHEPGKLLVMIVPSPLTPLPCE